MAKRSTKGTAAKSTKPKRSAAPKRGSASAQAAGKKTTPKIVKARRPINLVSLLRQGLKSALTVVGTILWFILFPIRPLLRPVGRYLVGVRGEFREVRWPKRREAWKLTFAVVGFAFVFVVLVQIIDYGIRLLFEKVII